MHEDLLWIFSRSVQFLIPSPQLFFSRNSIIPAEMHGAVGRKIFSVVKIPPFRLKNTSFDSSGQTLSNDVFFMQVRRRLRPYFRVTIEL